MREHMSEEWREQVSRVVGAMDDGFGTHFGPSRGGCAFRSNEAFVASY
jgi:hypothetical protein